MSHLTCADPHWECPWTHGGFFVALPIYQKLKLALPSHVDTLAEFSADMPKPEKVIVFEKNGSSYVEVIGVRPGFPSVPSGPRLHL